MKKIIILFLAGCIIMIAGLLVVVSRSKSKAGLDAVLPAMPKAVELLEEQPVGEEEPPLAPGEPLLN